MRLKARKTWSQHQLAVKLRVEGGDEKGLLTFERRRLLIHAAKTALAAALCWWLALRFGLHDGYWGAISAIIVLQSNVGATVTASRDRLLGTLMGAAFGFAFSVYGAPPWNYILAVLFAVIVCGLLGMRDSSRLAGVTITIIMLVPKAGPRWELTLDRVGEVLLGIVVALAVTTLVLPDRARVWLRDGLAQQFLLLGAFFEAILEGFRGAPSQILPTLREDVRALLRRNNQLLQAARNEPSGPGWREGLSMLSQFGRELFDALVALDLAVKDSHEDRFAQQLEPELPRLAADIRTGFNHVASCVHKWRFRAPLAGVSLEQDIADLESRMDRVRHTGIGFSQAEILRVYAVQLHLKQIARLLNETRIETGRAVGEQIEGAGSA
ncbi:MAG: FUSC family protein [Terracidiphilus sp.]